VVVQANEVMRARVGHVKERAALWARDAFVRIHGESRRAVFEGSVFGGSQRHAGEADQCIGLGKMTVAVLDVWKRGCVSDGNGRRHPAYVDRCT
jgi:hypothetical protein